MSLFELVDALDTGALSPRLKCIGGIHPYQLS